jgi:hypothetical protein
VMEGAFAATLLTAPDDGLSPSVILTLRGEKGPQVTAVLGKQSCSKVETFPTKSC